MKASLILIIFFAAGCANSLKTINSGKGSEQGFEFAKEFIGRNAEEEFSKNLQSGELRFYGVGVHLTDEIEVHALSKEEITDLIERRGFPIEAIAEDVNPFAVVEKDFSYSDYWKGLDEFITDYNKLVLQEIKRRDNHTLHSTGKSPAE